MKTMNGVAFVSAAISALMMTGCAGLTPTAAPVMAGTALHGQVYGGQQPIVGASIYLYAANTTVYGGASTNLLTQNVFTTLGGYFTVGGDYTCIAGQQLYIVAIGGNPGAGTNPQAANMAALGDCAGIGPSTTINMNELTTVGSTFALAPFMSGYSAVGTSATNAAGLVRAFKSVNKLVNIATGTAYGSALPSGATGPSAQVGSLGNILASCINSGGGVAGDGSSCGNLFSLATPANGTSPTDTIGLALAIAKNPTLNTAQIFAYDLPQSPFRPHLTITPADWTLAITYSGLHAPKSTTVDANGNIWLANSGNNTVTVLSQAGTTVATLTGNGLNIPSAIAIDASGDAFVANSGGSTLSAFKNAGAVFGSSPFTVGSGPTSLAFDASGDVWIANTTSKTLSELSASGSPIETISTGATAPSAIAINPK